MRHVIVFLFVAVITVCFFEAPQAVAEEINTVPLHGQLVAVNVQPSIANDGFSQDVQDMDAESDQLTGKIISRHNNKTQGKDSSSDGMTVTLIKLAHRHR